MGDGNESRDWKPIFLEALASTGHVTRAAKVAGITRQNVYLCRQSDPAFKAMFDEARAIAVGLLEDEAWRRAREGTLKPVYQNGKRVGKVREYSDTLLIFLLKANKPGMYRENMNLSINDGKPLIAVQWANEAGSDDASE